MFNFKKAEEKAKKLYHLSWFLKVYMKYVCSDFPTEEDVRYSVVIDYIGKAIIYNLPQNMAKAIML